MAASFPQQVVCPVLIGRSAQLSALHQFIDRASDSHGQTLLITGDAGVGKSRLITEAKAYVAARGLYLLQGNCFPQDSACPYAPLLDLLRARFADHAPEAIVADVGPFARELAPLLPDLVSLPADLPLAPLDLEQQKRRLFAALAHCLTGRATPQPIILIVEDLHWSDEGSLDFLLYLVRRSTLPLLLIGTYRGDEVGPRLSSWLAQLAREHMSQELSLTPLTRDEVAAMLWAIFTLDRPARAEFLDAIYALTEGNPFYVEELLKSLVAAGDIFYADGAWERKPIAELRIPHSLNDTVRRRVVQLSEEARRMLALAAVVGRQFDFGLLQQLARVDEGDLLRLIKELRRWPRSSYRSLSSCVAPAPNTRRRSHRWLRRSPTPPAFSGSSGC
ncbi:MAG TPA: AAA family ATPase [Roseiflexaceae bacterium]